MCSFVSMSRGTQVFPGPYMYYPFIYLQVSGGVDSDPQRVTWPSVDARRQWALAGCAGDELAGAPSAFLWELTQSESKISPPPRQQPLTLWLYGTAPAVTPSRGGCGPACL